MQPKTPPDIPLPHGHPHQHPHEGPLDLAGTPADPTLSPLVRRALDENWSAAESTAASTVWDAQAMWATFDTRRTQHTTSSERSSSRASRWRGVWIVTSAMMLIASIGLGAWWTTARRHTTDDSRVYRTAVAQHATVRLANGSSITLAPATVVHMTPTVVTVTGQAYFDIAPQPTHPFVVHTANAEVRVLGTRFTVRQYPGEPASQVVVANGKVDLARLTTSHIPTSPVRTLLTTRMLGRVTNVDGDSSVTVSCDVAVDDYMGWTQGTLVFTSVPLHDVALELSRAYGVDIRVRDSVLASQPLTFVARVRTQSLTQVLEFIGRVTEAHYTRVDSATFVMTPGRVLPRAPQRPRLSSPELQYGK